MLRTRHFYYTAACAAVFLCGSVTSSASVLSSTKQLVETHVANPFYFGGSFGYGNTDWSKISTDLTYAQAAEAAPISADSGVAAFGGFLGYQFSRYFTVETSYTHFDTAKVNFGTDAEGVDNLYGLAQLKTDTDVYSLLGKLLVPFGYTKAYIYADAGVSYVYRYDIGITQDPSPIGDISPPYQLQHTGSFGPSFGFGLMDNFAPHWLAEASFQYTTGYDKVTNTPVYDYVPFVYSIMLNIGYRV